MIGPVGGGLAGGADADALPDGEAAVAVTVGEPGAEVRGGADGLTDAVRAKADALADANVMAAVLAAVLAPSESGDASTALDGALCTVVWPAEVEPQAVAVTTAVNARASRVRSTPLGRRSPQAGSAYVCRAPAGQHT